MPGEPRPRLGPAAGGVEDRRRLGLVLAITTTILIVEVIGAVGPHRRGRDRDRRLAPRGPRGLDPHRVLILPADHQTAAETVEVLLEATPRGLDLAAVRQHLLDLPHVRAVHDLHASQIATGLPVPTAHVVVDDSCFQDGHAS